MLHIRRSGRPARVLTLRLTRLVSDQVVTIASTRCGLSGSDYLLTGNGWQPCDILLAIRASGDRRTMAEAGPTALIRVRLRATY